ncbi:uncharacterized protein LOC121735673 [Aricia agestis]|uniref:uncharacterized protein LOC121735673 n=1 Tax=Aricia agestis TaxID=91739 RepID=UPI001C20A434|nr:uncharacterized protein LOC121735673 [Aricia agestis]
MASKENEDILCNENERPTTFVIQRFNKNDVLKGKSLTCFNSIVKIWTDFLTRKNYVPVQNLSDIVKDLKLPASILKNLLDPTEDSEDIITKSIYRYLTLKIDKINLWEHFFNFPELYDEFDVAHVVQCDATNIDDGVLTREVVARCLSCLHKSPLSGVYTYIKLDLAAKRLLNIDVLQHYKYLVYLDLSSNCLTEVKVLSHLVYLQHLSLHSNSLGAVLDYDIPQWLLTEVYYGHNHVTEIRDLSLFWSITVLDLSHNHIEYINGLENLQFLRRLDLSYNKIKKLENLSNSKLLWLNLSHNDIASFECDEKRGLHTLHQLEYLNVDDNRLGTMKVLSGCARLRELRACNNSFTTLHEVPLCLWQLACLVTVDLRDNPLCGDARYRRVTLNTLPSLYQLDGKVLDPVEISTTKLDMRPDVFTMAERRLLRLLYIEQLSRARVTPYVPPADTDVPIVVLVGPEAVGRGDLARRIAERYHNVDLAKQHTTSSLHSKDHYKLVTRKHFDNMLIAGDLLTCSSVADGTCGLSREKAFVGNGKVKIAIMDLVGALMLRLRGYRPYFILTWCSDKEAMKRRQEDRKRPTEEATTLQVLVSDRIIIGGILQEIIRVAMYDDECPSFSTFSTETRAQPCCACDVNCKCCPCKVGDHSKDYIPNSTLKGESSSLSSSLKESTEDDNWMRSQWATPDNFVPSMENDYDYENIHRNRPGMFWDTIAMDDPDAAYIKLKRIIKDIVSEQKKQKLFDMNFTSHNNNLFKKKMEKISLQLAQQRLFY